VLGLAQQRVAGKTCLFLLLVDRVVVAAAVVVAVALFLPQVGIVPLFNVEALEPLLREMVGFL
jgi:hypothetical protein